MADSEVIARRTTYDGKRVLFWDDGAVTSGMNWYVKGGKLKTTSMLWALADEVSLYDWSELPTLLRVAKRVEQRKSWTLPELRRAWAEALER